MSEYAGPERRRNPERITVEDHQTRLREHERELLRLMRKQGWQGCARDCSCRGTQP